MADSPAIARVTALVAPILADLDLDLYDLDYGAGLLKITIDKPGGADLEVIALATRLIRREFEHSDPVAGDYTLEVSSPGIERSLRRPDHFTRVIGATVSVRLPKEAPPLASTAMLTVNSSTLDAPVEQDAPAAAMTPPPPERSALSKVRVLPCALSRCCADASVCG